MPDTTFNNTIKDTIVLEYSKGYVRFETIRREGDKYFAVTSDNKDVEITSMINGKTRALVKDDEGHELVIDKDGNVMGVEEYKKCGGSSKLLSEHNAHRDSTMSASGNITFSKVEKETYGFDEWRGADYDKDVYDNFNGYRPTYIGAQKQSNIKVSANQTKGIRFITERGVPIIANTADNTLNLAIGTAGKQTVYAYSDSTLVGKLCIQAYDQKEVKVHVVRVNNGKQLELNKIADEVNRIYSSAVVHYTFDELEPIEIEYANHKHFVHGGKGTFQNYNTDQKTAIKALPETADQNDYYLFFTECYNRLDTAGNASPEAVNGYMPVGRHYGFIYNEYTNARTIAHELGHGTNSLHHTFSQESESFYTTKETDNLMDYHAGEYLNHRQWQWAHEKHRNILGFLDDEGESEIRESSSIKWLGDWLEGYFYDDLEKKTETDLPIFNKMFESYNDLKTKAKDEHQTFGVNKYYTIICNSPTFCVKNYPTLRLDNKYYDKGQKLRNIYDKFSNSKNVDFQGVFFSDRNIYLEEYKLEGIEYKLALYAGNELSLSYDKYSIKTFSELRDNNNIKVGYTSKFALIVLYKQNMPYLTIQIIGGDPKTSAIKWTNYLSLICYSETQSVADRSILEQVQIYEKEKLEEIWSASFKSEDFKKLQQIEELTPKEIREYREFIKTLPEDERADWYLELQKKVPYHNQRNNSSQLTTVAGNDVNIGDVMCNVTSMVMALEMLGFENPCAPNIAQFEDCIEKHLKDIAIEKQHKGTFKFKPLNDSNKYDNSREYADSRESVIDLMFSNSVLFGSKEFSVKDDIEKIKVLLKDRLSKGDGVIVSYKGHFIRIVSCNDESFTYDDPYGSYTIGIGGKRVWSKGKTNGKATEDGEGKNNERKWSDYNNVTNERFYIEYYHEN
ncbi:MAG: hypothetical protein J6Y72_11990 [Bacteroidales bacterium]|nr:hypothetical protein [Bacteroidales bacterium]